MELLEPGEIAEFGRILHNEHLPRGDFVLTEIDTTDPKTDELLPLKGCLTVRCVSTGRSQDYEIGDGTEWLHLFRKDIQDQVFAAPPK
jgi:hypothetical protein